MPDLVTLRPLVSDRHWQSQRVERSHLSTLVCGPDGPRQLDVKHALIEVTVPIEGPLAGGLSEATGSSCRHPVTISLIYAWAGRTGVVIANEHKRVTIRRCQRLVVVAGKSSSAATVRDR